jgi:hypothetical protein
VKITNGFPSGYTAGDVIQFKLNGITNPPTIATTGSIVIDFYYAAGESEVLNSDNLLTFNAEASPNLTLKVALSS